MKKEGLWQTPLRPSDLSSARTTEEISHNIGEWYKLPDHIVNRGLNTEIVAVSRGQLIADLASYLRDSRDYLRSLPRRKTPAHRALEKLFGGEFDENDLPVKDDLPEAVATREVENVGAIFLPSFSNSDRKVCIVNDFLESLDSVRLADVVEHEIFHSMGWESPSGRQGFTEWIGRKDILSSFDEASIEVLRIARLTRMQIGILLQPGSGRARFFDALLNSVAYAYIRDINTLMTLIIQGNPIGRRLDFLDLAHYYFGLKPDTIPAIAFFGCIFANLSTTEQREKVVRLSLNTFLFGGKEVL